MPTTYLEGGRVIQHAGAVPTAEELAGTVPTKAPVEPTAPEVPAEPDEVAPPPPAEAVKPLETPKAPAKSQRVSSPRLPVAKPKKGK